MRALTRASMGLLLGCLLLAPAVAAQELTGTLYGVVKADDGALIPGASVTIKSPAMIRGQGVLITNKEGRIRRRPL